MRFVVAALCVLAASALAAHGARTQGMTRAKSLWASGLLMLSAAAFATEFFPLKWKD